jgi:hypothetical protein
MSGTGKNLKLLAVMVALAIAGAACGTVRAEDQSAAAPTNLLVPAIELSSVPLSQAIKSLARNAGVNYLIAPLVLNEWAASAEPLITFKVKNATAKDVLVRLLGLHKLALVEDPVSGIALIVPARHAADSQYDGLSQSAALAHTNLIPLIEFDDVPITTTIEHLARQDGINYLIDPRVTRMWSETGEPQLSFRLENVTCWSTLQRMLSLQGLVLADEPALHAALITFANEPAPAPDASLIDLAAGPAGAATNEIIPLIQFSDVPLDVALEHLARQAGLRAEIHLQTGHSEDGLYGAPVLNLRWTDITGRQALAALCLCFHLTITPDDESGVLRIAPRPAKTHHHLLR